TSAGIVRGAGYSAVNLSCAGRCGKSLAGEVVGGSFRDCETAIVFRTHFFFDFRHTGALVIQHTRPDGSESASIFDGEDILKRAAIVDDAISLDHMKRLCVWRSKTIGCGFVVHADSVDHQRVAFVVPD